MPYPHASYTALRSQALSDIASANIPGIGVVLPASVYSTTTETLAGMVFGLYQYLDYIALQTNPFTATGEYLEAWAAFKTVARIDATPATGSASFVGTAGADIPDGTLVTRADGYQYTTVGDVGVSSSGTALASLIASVPGIAGNAASGISLVLGSPIVGVLATGAAVGPITGGDAQETDSSLRTRMLDVFAQPSQGGSAADFVNWALSTPGCTRAWVGAAPTTPGTLVLYVMFDVSEAANGGFPVGSNGGALAEARISPATGDQLAVANVVYPNRPVTSLVYVAGPYRQAVNLTINSLTPSTPAVQAAIQGALSDLFVRIGTPLGGTIYPSDLSAAISSAAGVQSFSLAGDGIVTTAVGHLPVVGTLSYT